MHIARVIWLSEIEDKLAEKHNVTVDEVEDILFGKHETRFVSKGHRANEDVYSATGQTTGGRYLIVFFIVKKKREALILSARDMDSKERKRYGKHKN